MKIIRNDEGRYLCSRIEIRIKCASGLLKIKKILQAYPNLTLVKEGNQLTYLLEDEQNIHHFYVMEFSKDRVSLTIHSEQTPALFISEALLRLLGVAQAVSEICEFELVSFYPYLMISLAAQRIPEMKEIRVQTQYKNSDLVLTKRIIALTKENILLKESSRRAEETLRGATERALARSAEDIHTIEDARKELDLNEEEARSALEGIGAFGYKMIYLSKDKFNLVRL